MLKTYLKLRSRLLFENNTAANMGFGYTGGGRTQCFGLLYMADQQSGDPTPQARRV